MELPYDSAIPLLGIYLKEGKSVYNKGTCILHLLQLYSQQPSYGNSQDAPQLMNGLRKYGIYIQWSFIQPQRRMKSCHFQVNGWNWKISS
jgi:hypothetical protein